MSTESLTYPMLSSIEIELQRQIARLDQLRTKVFHEMLCYQMGWTGEGAGPEATGKRIRPLLMLLTAASVGVKWEDTLPAAASLELIHNFSLVHDDVQDKSDLRRGRPTVWKNWGIAQAINIGDALFVIANLAISDLQGKYSPEQIFKVNWIIQETCLALTCGQFMDISFETRNNLTIEDYWPMVAGKTAALLATCTHIGAILGGVDDATQEAYKNFGHYLGMAFQVQDDILGIWGNSALTGKSNESDLVSGKNSLPVLYCLGKGGSFTKRWKHGPITADEVPTLAEQMTSEGARLYAQETSDQMMDLALKFLRMANPRGEAGEVLFKLSQSLLQRQT